MLSYSFISFLCVDFFIIFFFCFLCSYNLFFIYRCIIINYHSQRVIAQRTICLRVIVSMYSLGDTHVFFSFFFFPQMTMSLHCCYCCAIPFFNSVSRKHIMYVYSYDALDCYRCFLLLLFFFFFGFCP